MNIHDRCRYGVAFFLPATPLQWTGVDFSIGAGAGEGDLPP
ncbi:hypothetical protein ASZ90_009835 [hydrocarbon metagenome]|uniref:Uncharacterized protein n=1 Tax=hydrocarbon metagenome TaxID=938273 RepID=A0A0W8FHP8_9ZZZZ